MITLRATLALVVTTLAATADLVGAVSTPRSIHSSSSSDPLAKRDANSTQYDVVIVGGGPAGLSAAMSLGRVNRKALLIDSGHYRNYATQEVHDVITIDGTPPALVRYKARQQLQQYFSVTLQNGTVTSIIAQNGNTSFVTTDSMGMQYTSKKVILATGIIDQLPMTPGFAQGWGKGIYWCPWCDGWEHRNQTLGRVGNFSADYINGSVAQQQLNPSITLLTNGSMTPDAINKTAQTLPQWQSVLSHFNLTVDNRTIVSFARAGGNWSNYTDDFIVSFDDGSERQFGAIRASYATTLQSANLSSALNLTLNTTKASDPEIQVNGNMLTSVPGIYAVGDCNSDHSTNVPHAMWSAKRAVINIHENLGDATIAAFLTSGSSSSKAKRYIKAAANSAAGRESYADMRRGLAHAHVEENSAEDFMQYIVR